MADENVLFTHFDVDRYSMIAWGKNRDAMKVYWPVLRNHGVRLQYDQDFLLKRFEVKYPHISFPRPEERSKADIVKKYGDVVYSRDFHRL